MFAEVRKGTITIPTSDTVQVGTAVVVITGDLSSLVVSVPALEGTGTATILGTDGLGGTIYTSTAVNESALATVRQFGTPGNFDGTLTLTATANGTQSAARSIPFNLYYGAKHG